jgi:SAM-dependent methyltransferase
MKTHDPIANVTYKSMSLKPPRYLLREATVRKILKKMTPGNFLEIGYGEGNMLVTLAHLGFWGDGYDFSEGARQKAELLLRRKRVMAVSLLEILNTEMRYDYIFFFEVIGYWKNPAEEIAFLTTLLKPGGRIIFSFSDKRTRGYAEKLTGDMKCFTRQEILNLLERDLGLRVDLLWNYGFPLANLLKPFLDIFHLLRSHAAGADEDEEKDIKNSGLAQQYLAVKLISIVLNPVTIYPFAVFQFLFKNTDLGNGYVVVAGIK